MKPTTEDILEAACVAYGVSLEDITRRCRRREVLQYRQVVQYMCKRLDTDVLSQIAQSTNVHQHGTVLHSYHLIEKEMGMYEGVGERVTKLEEGLILKGFKITPVPKPLSYTGSYTPQYNNIGRKVPVRIYDPETEESRIVDSVWEAHRQTGAPRRGITNACRKIGKVRSKFKFSYDV